MGMHATFLPRAGTGVEGLDFVLGGGFARNRLHLLEGSPGTGKTTIALQFLLEGAGWRSRHLHYPRRDREGAARRRGGPMAGPSATGSMMFELVPPESLLDPEHQQSLLYSSDLELGETTSASFEAIERIKPVAS